MKKKIICTIGPSTYKKNILRKFSKLGVNIFRINLSHTTQKDFPNRLNFLKKNIGTSKICIDTEGAQIRTTNVREKFNLKIKSKIEVLNRNQISTNKKIFLYPKFNLLSVPINTLIYIGFDGLILKIKKRNILKKSLTAEVYSSGVLESNKGVHLNKQVKLNSLTEKDKKIIHYAKKSGIKLFAMSFVNNGQDVNEIRKLIGNKCFLISKIETSNAIKNIKSISRNSDALLIDRGDLSRYVSIEKIPLAQEFIIKNAKKMKIPVYVATNLLETMVKYSLPTRAESHDIYSTLKQGASGLVLAAETAIGANPLKCIIFLKKCINAYGKKNSKFIN
tara:strand:- start:228 stop:1229 length:1002 start_codon:yes stop_codon:yes gene_type:complete